MANLGGRFHTIGRTGTWQVRAINSVSDGDKRHWPGKPTYRPSGEERYLIILGNSWAKKDGIDKAQPGVQFYIDQLPNGYALFEMDQPGGSGNVYKRLFGHPSGRYYDSIPRFEPHFLWLMSEMQGQCDCVLCSKGTPRPPAQRTRKIPDASLLPSQRRYAIRDAGSESSSRSESAVGRAGGTSTRPQRQIKAAGAPFATDERGNEDVYKLLVNRLYKARDSRKGIEDDIQEPNHMDWRATHDYGGYGENVTKIHLTSVELQHSFIPRVGELVLWIPNFLHEHSLMVDENSEYKYYSFSQECFHGHPDWRAGVIAEVPSAKTANGPIDFTDIQSLPKKNTSLNTAGFRVETFPDPNDEVDKSASKQYRYVPLRNIRPLSHWHMLLRGIPRDRWHASIKNALTCMTSMSLLEKFWFSGEWPNAHIRCKGIFLGPELIIVGDTVRIRPESSASGAPKRCTDVMIVDQIRLNLLNIDAEYTLPDSGHLASSYTITLKGRGYTLDIHRSYEIQAQGTDAMRTEIPAAVPLAEVKTVFNSVGAADYGHWYHLHDPTKRYEISHDMVLGRMHEAGAVQLWTGQLQTQEALDKKLAPKLDFDVYAIEAARRFATQNDMRLEAAPDTEIRWYLGDHRADALDLEIFNGQKIGRYEETRDKATQEQWRNQLKLLNGQSVTPDMFKYTSFTEITLPGTRGRKPGSKVINGKVIRPGQPGYDGAGTEDQVKPLGTPKHKQYSQLAGAALVSTDEDEEGEDEGEDESDADADVATSELGVDNYYSAPEDRTGSAEPSGGSTWTNKPKPLLTKTEIMSGIEPADFDDYYSSEESWLEAPMPFARGGTEESDGGDYRPEPEPQSQEKY
ncbi:uncharacterized protein A1O9_10659 [Exophiala aquamarina CBS 119918]|uniref:Cryptic loci regulator 2 N-terminal domain-containing protein n=1 Tax=Exophiala aquamarina CBS 119918 TaxID=1182545 RepID=A0A072P047_9EURO|nr:uncharacterized protein A1O9_10659 [Exophiala aquamarina CBS 119918]KEF53211.1 hypothetical protein A1O9_10659 [Exophiala aquamarina CBS 119918]